MALLTEQEFFDKYNLPATGLFKTNHNFEVEEVDLRELVQDIKDNFVHRLNASSGSAAWGSITGDDITLQTDLVQYVAGRIATLVDSSPDALNTLNELAASLGDDPNFATTVLNALAGKEPTINPGTAGQYWDGTKTWKALPSSTVSVADGVVSGLQSSFSLLEETITAGKWNINNQGFQTTGSTVFSHAAADATFDRIDLVVARTDNTLQLIPGVASATPVKPTVPANTIEVNFSIIGPGGVNTTTVNTLQRLSAVTTTLQTRTVDLGGAARKETFAAIDANNSFTLGFTGAAILKFFSLTLRKTTTSDIVLTLPANSYVEGVGPASTLTLSDATNNTCFELMLKMASVDGSTIRYHWTLSAKF